MMQIPIGFILMFGIVLVPVYIAIWGSIFTKPKNTKAAALFLLMPAVIIALSIVGMWVLGAIIQFVIP